MAFDCTVAQTKCLITVIYCDLECASCLHGVIRTITVRKFRGIVPWGEMDAQKESIDNVK